MNTQNLFVVGWVFTGIVASFLILEYYTLTPVMFLIGLGGAALVAGLKVLRMETRPLVIVVIVSIIIALADEFSHTTAGVLTYFDGGTPSFLTVLGWGLFIIVIVAVAEFLVGIPSVAKVERKELRVLPALLAIILIPILVIVTGYSIVFDLLLIATYVVLGVASLVYTQKHPFNWNLSIFIGSIFIGGVMEFIGGVEGLWSYYFFEPLAWFMVLTWALRTWTILAICSLFNVEFGHDTSQWLWQLIEERFPEMPWIKPESGS
jgi:hypothetical protein